MIDPYVKKLERRIHNQRVALRWWHANFNSHVHSHILHGLLGRRAGIRRAVLAIEKLRTKKETQ